MDSRTDKTALSSVSQGFLSLWLILFVVWTVANGSLALPVAALGLVVTFLLARTFAARSDTWRRISWTPQAARHFFAYTGVFLVELVKANLMMMRIVYSPRIAITPGIVKIRTKLTSPIGRLALANTIALTPGSLVLDIEDDTLLIHWLDVQTTDVAAATENIAGPYETHLEKVFC